MPELIYALDIHADLTADDIGPGPFGQRFVVNVTGGHVAGDQLKGAIVGASGDWLLIGADGFGHLDVRFTLKTVDEANVYVQYYCVLELTPAVQEILGEGARRPATAISTSSRILDWRQAMSDTSG